MVLLFSLLSLSRYAAENCWQKRQPKLKKQSMWKSIEGTPWFRHDNCLWKSFFHRKTDTFIVFYLSVLYSVTCLQTCHFTACFASLWKFISVSTLIMYVMSARFCLYLLIFITLLTHCYRDTHIQLLPWHTHTVLYHIVHTMWMVTIRHRSLVERGGGKGFGQRQRPCTHTKKEENNVSTPIMTSQIYERFGQMVLQQSY